MRAVIWFVLLFVVAVVAATTLGSNDGLVSFYWAGQRLDLSLNLFLILLALTCFVLVTVFGSLFIVTGKRFWAHGPTGDVEPNAPAVLYWFQLVRDQKSGAAEFVPHLIDSDSGVGMQIAFTPPGDIAISNKKGTFVFLRSRGR